MAKVFLTISGTSIPRVSLNEILDVDTSGGQDGYVLTQQADGTFALEQVAQSLEGLSDTQVGNAQSGNTLQYNGAYWVPVVLSIPSGDIYYRDRYASEAETLLDGGAETLELYYTAQADGDGLHEDAQTDTPRSGYDIRRKLYYSEAAQADPDTGTWVQFADIADDTTYASAKATLLAYLKARTGGTVPISLKMTWEEVAEAPTFTGLLNESYGSGAAAAYSVRRLNGNYTGAAIEVERSSDNTTQDIGFDANGDLDESALTTFCTGTTCKVRTWYGQEASGGTGSGNDAVQTTHANQPTIYTGGAIVKDSGRVALDYDGIESLSATFTSAFSQPNSISAVGLAENSEVKGTISDGYTNRNLVNFANASGAFSIFAGSALTGSDIRGERREIFAVFNASSSSAHVDGVQDISGNAGAATLGTRIDLGAGGGSVTPTNSLHGFMQEWILWNTDKSTDRTDIEENIGDYYTQNTPLLDTYTGAAAAYSLRKLSSSYSGSAIRVRRSSDNTEQDIGFNVFGELDTVSLTAFAGAGDAFVKTWYDQSGNSNDATQTATGSQPQIVSSGAVIVENGKVAMQLDGSNDYLNASTSDLFGTNFALYFVHRITGGSTRKFLIETTSTGSNVYNPSLEYGETTLPSKIRTFSGSAATSTATIESLIQFDSSQRIITVNKNGTTNFELFADGSSLGTATPPNVTGMNGFNLGTYRSANDRYFGGTFQEVILYDSDQSANRTNIESNIATFYDITI